jgi:hypothetical protein
MLDVRVVFMRRSPFYNGGYATDAPFAGKLERKNGSWQVGVAGIARIVIQLRLCIIDLLQAIGKNHHATFLRRYPKK